MNNFSKNKTIWILLVAMMIIIIGASSAVIGSAKTPPMTSTENPPMLWIVAGEPSETVVKNPPPQEFLLHAPQTANITVNYNGVWDAEAQNAFEYAVSIWETQITSSVPIIVEAEWEDLGNNSGILGGARAATLHSDFPNAPLSNTLYPVALANKISGTDLYAGVDILAVFNSAFPNWYFGTDGNPGGSIDFASVVLHEIGHGLGFFGLMRYGSDCGGSNLGCWAPQQSNIPGIYDRFAENEAGTPLLSFPNYSPELGEQLTSNVVYFDGPNANAANGNTRVPLVTTIFGNWQPGSSYSHLAESFNGTANALMTYSLGAFEANHNPGPVMLGMFADMGWAISAPIPTSTPTPTVTPLGTCVPVTSIPPQATPVGDQTSYLPVVQNYLNCLPPRTATPTPTATATSTGGYTNLFFDNFESAFPGSWQLFSFGSTSGFQWGQSNCNPYQGSFSAWGIGGGSSGLGYPCDTDYPLNVDNWMIYGPFSTVGMTAADLTFETWFNTETQWDTMCFLASSVGGTIISDYDGWCWSGNSYTVENNVNGWVADGLNIGDIFNDGGSVNLLGDESVWISFVFFSDFSAVFPTGVFVDNVLVRGCATNCVFDLNVAQPLGSDVQKLTWDEFQALKENTSKQ